MQKREKKPDLTDEMKKNEDLWCMLLMIVFRIPWSLGPEVWIMGGGVKGGRKANGAEGEGENGRGGEEDGELSEFGLAVCILAETIFSPRI